MDEIWDMPGIWGLGKGKGKEILAEEEEEVEGAERKKCSFRHTTTLGLRFVDCG